MARPDVLQRLSDELARAPHPLLNPQAPHYLRHTPGRLDVLGALGAEAGGTIAQMALPARVAVAFQPREEPSLFLHSDNIAPPLGKPEVSLPVTSFPRHAATLSPADIAAVACGPAAWTAPVVALWIALADHPRYALPPGATLLIRSDIPMGAGQASSTALLLALLLALTATHPHPLDPTEAALLIQRAESLLTPGNGPAIASNSHVLDALTCLLATPHALLRYSAQPHRLVGPVPLPRDVRVLALDTGVRYTSARETLDELRLASAMGKRIIDTIYRDLGQTHTPLHGYLANTSPLLYRQYFRTLLPKRLRGSDFTRTYGPLPEGAGTLDPATFYRVRTAVDHLIAENEHAEQFLQAMEELADTPLPLPGDIEADNERQKLLQRAGRLALASHHSYRLRLELSCREADWLVDRLMEAGPDRGLFGARITGCGGGGTVMVLTDTTPAATDAILEVMKSYTQMTGLTLGIQEAGAAGSLSP